MNEILDGVIRAAENAGTVEPNDFYDEDGFCRCGKCGERKQTEIRVPNPLAPGEYQTRRVPVACKCKREADAERERILADHRRYERWERSMMDVGLYKATFEASDTVAENRKAMQMCEKYAERWDVMRANNQGLLLYGGVGTGKTYAAGCIANALLEKGVDVVMTSFVRILKTAQRFDEEEDRLLEKLNRAALLIIDDLGAERGTDFALEKVYDVIDERYRSQRPLILTTNLDLEAMKTEADIRYQRIYDRIFEMCFPLQFKGRSRRRDEANRRYKDMAALINGDGESRKGA